MDRRMGFWSDAIFEGKTGGRGPGGPFLVGVDMGEGIGPEVMGCALQVLEAVASVCGRRFEIRVAPEGIFDFCGRVFAAGGAVLSGPRRGRHVYDFRKRFDLYCKLSPLRPCSELLSAGCIKPEHAQAVDILVVRDNAAGVYQGQWREVTTPDGGRRAEHSFAYSEAEARRILQAAATIARQRRGAMTVVYKEAGIPAISKLWQDCAAAVAAEAGVKLSLLDIDYAAFRLIQNARDLDVVVAPNLFGDVLSDLGAVLLGSRALAYSGNFAATGAAVYQTNHGAALDLAGTDRANPVGQILALAMMLRESFHLVDEASLVEDAVTHVWRLGWRTFDLADETSRPVGTRAMGALCAEAVHALKGQHRAGQAPAVLTAAIVGGKLAGGPTLRALSRRSPRSPEATLASVPVCEAAQAAEAVAAAQRAWRDWRDSDPADRAALLGLLSDRLEQASERLVHELAEEIGKPVVYGAGEVRAAVAVLRAVARRACPGRDSDSGSGTTIRHRSVGVVALVTPWNNPLFIPLGKIAPALAYGNTVVWKPAPAGSAMAIRVMEEFAAAGCPPGALNLICGDGTTAEHLLADSRVDAVTLTGSIPAGLSAQRICARRHVPLQAELGGNNAAIVWSDYDLEDAAGQIAEAAFGQAGQRCTANRRVIVEQHWSARLLHALERATARLGWGDPLDTATRVGPLLSPEQAERASAMVERASAVAGRVIVPHEACPSFRVLRRQSGYYPPTIICCDRPDHEIVQEETFGPVLVVQTARDWDHAIELTNGVRQGLVAAVFSNSQDLQRRFLADARAGILKLNRATADADVELPFGGWKASGIGPPEHGESDREFYTRTQAIYR
jgi:acyl-CoA reductase-like NAD-dependent aldehyde dehydrogenase/isocitrate/isopropylmalate dehydrogenase